MTKTPYSIRIESDLLEKLKAQAKIETRSVNNMIEFAMKDYLTRASKNKK